MSAFSRPLRNLPNAVARVINSTKNCTLAENAVIADRLTSRICGLLGRGSLAPDEGMVLVPCDSVHTFFMRFAIDVLFLDRNRTVVRTVENLKPNRLSPLVWKAFLAVELPANTLSRSKTSIGDRIIIEP